MCINSLYCEVSEGLAKLLGLETNHIDIETRHVGYNVLRERDFMSSVHHCRLRFHTMKDAEHIQNTLCNIAFLDSINTILYDQKI